MRKFFLGLAVAVLVVLSGCGRKQQPPQVGDIVISPTDSAPITQPVTQPVIPPTTPPVTPPTTPPVVTPPKNSNVPPLPTDDNAIPPHVAVPPPSTDKDKPKPK